MSDENHDDVDEQDDQGEEKFESWDAFWEEIRRKEEAERGGPKTEIIRGVMVLVPHDLPIRFDRRLDQLKGSSSDEDLKALLADLFGADVLDAWIDAGMTPMELRVVLMWGVAQGKGRAMSFRQAYELVKEGSEGKAESSTRKNGSAGSTGGRSKRTSARATSSNGTSSRT